MRGFNMSKLGAAESQSLIRKTLAFMVQIKAGDFDGMPPAERRRFADLCKHLASIGEPKKAPPKIGVLADLKSVRGHE
jgi:hypothetical protein